MSTIASEATIRIAYDGEALRSGTMDVRDLAPALLALSDLFDSANKVLNGNERTIQLRIRHDVKRGSFDIGIEVIQTWASKILSIFSSDLPSGAANLIEILGFAVGAPFGLIKLIKWLRNRPVKRVEILNENDVRLIIEGDEIVIRRPLAKVFNDVGVRRALAAVFAPLNQNGIDTFEAKAPDGTVVEQVVKGELEAFTPPDANGTASQPINVTEFRQAYTIMAVTFKDGNKWRLSDGQNTIAVTIEDAGFLQKVNNREVSFAKDDVITCEVRHEQSITSSGLKTDVFVKRVVEHHHAPRQMILPIPEAPHGDIPAQNNGGSSGKDDVAMFSSAAPTENSIITPPTTASVTPPIIPSELNKTKPQEPQATTSRDAKPTKRGPAKNRGGKRKR